MDMLLKIFGNVVEGKGSFIISEDTKLLTYKIGTEEINVTKAISECDFSKLDVDQDGRTKYIEYKKAQGQAIYNKLTDADLLDSFYIHKEDYKKYTQEEITAIKTYTREQFDGINGMMRGDYTPFTRDTMKNDIKQTFLDMIMVSAALNKHKLHEETASKTVLMRLENPKRLETQGIEQDGLGDFIQLGFLSTTSLTISNKCAVPSRWNKDGNFSLAGKRQRLIVFKGFDATPVSLLSAHKSEEEMLIQHGQFMHCVYNRSTNFYRDAESLTPYELTVIVPSDKVDTNETKEFIKQVSEFKTAEGLYHFFCNANTHLADENAKINDLIKRGHEATDYEDLYNPYDKEPENFVVPTRASDQDIQQKANGKPNTSTQTDKNNAGTGVVIAISAVVLAAVLAYAFGVNLNTVRNIIKGVFDKSSGSNAL